MLTYNGYTLVPGTNQLIKSYPSQGSALFGQYGYNIPNPGYGDYYNGMQVHGMGFFDSLGELLAGLGLGLAKGSAAGGGNAGGSTLFASHPKAAAASAGGSSWNPFALSAPTSFGNLNSEISTGFKSGLASTNFSGPDDDDYDDDEENECSNWAGPNNGQRFLAYQELLNHLQNQYQRENWLGIRPFAAQPLYVGAYEVPNLGFAVNPAVTYEGARLPGQQSQNYQQGPDAMPVPATDTIFGINKKIAIVAAVIIAVILFMKYK